MPNAQPKAYASICQKSRYKETFLHARGVYYVRQTCHMPFHFVFQVIIDFLYMLNSTEQESVNNTKLFASQMTNESLQVISVSQSSTLSLGIRYLLTVKLNQDPLKVTLLGLPCFEITIF